MKTSKFSHQRGRSRRGLHTERYTPQDQTSETPIVILTGFGTTPPPKGDRAELSDQELRRTSYLGLFPGLTAQLTGHPVHITYHPAVSGLITKGGLYSADTAQMQFEESPEGHYFLHSMAACIGYDLLTKDRRYADITDKAKSITLAAPWTDATDAFSLDGKMRKVLGVKLDAAFKLLQFIPAPCWYPDSPKHFHDGDGETESSKHWGADPLARATSAKYALFLNAENKLTGVKPEQTPLVIIPTQDKIFEPEGQRNIAKMLRVKPVEIETGHRFFTADRELLEPVIHSIHEHIEASE
tara:strand:- start:1464 stop:2357 length:894 start_codon:yes stop_codon:yes gene_type:complete